jgi:hypothetical protein
MIERVKGIQFKNVQGNNQVSVQIVPKQNSERCNDPYRKVFGISKKNRN